MKKLLTKPPITRTPDEMKAEYDHIKKEMRTMYDAGIITPDWANKFEYMTNNFDAFSNETELDEFNWSKIKGLNLTVRKHD